MERERSDRQEKMFKTENPKADGTDFALRIQVVHGARSFSLWVSVFRYLERRLAPIRPLPCLFMQFPLFSPSHALVLDPARYRT